MSLESARRSNFSAKLIAILCCASLFAVVGCEAIVPEPIPTPSPSASPIPSVSPMPSASPIVDPPATADWVWGVTLDDVSGISSIVNSLKGLSARPTARVVFDEYVEPKYYLEPVRKISQVADVMGELLDSFYVKDLTVSEYVARTARYLDQLGSNVKIWEVGNEVNGEWLGTTPDVVQKVAGAFDQVKARGYKAALTLYYNEDCWAKRSHEMFKWTEKNIPERMKSGLDYVWVSFYEDDCNGIQPNWHEVFTRLAQIFPNSKIGFGEVGTKHGGKKREYLGRYYTMEVETPHFVGGYFWWYYRQDMVPAGGVLWNDLDQIIAAKSARPGKVADAGSVSGVLRVILDQVVEVASKGWVALRSLFGSFIP